MFLGPPVGRQLEDVSQWRSTSRAGERIGPPSVAMMSIVVVGEKTESIVVLREEQVCQRKPVS